MSRRTTQQSKIDELAFPVRVKIAVPGDGLGRELSLMREWLHAELGSGQYCKTSGASGRWDHTASCLGQAGFARFVAASS